MDVHPYGPSSTSGKKFYVHSLITQYKQALENLALASAGD